VLRSGAAHGYCVGLITPASLAGEAAYSYSPYAVPSLARGKPSQGLLSMGKEEIHEAI